MNKLLKNSITLLSALPLSLAVANTTFAENANSGQKVKAPKGAYAMTYFESCTFSDRAFGDEPLEAYDPETGEVLEELLTIRNSSLTAIVKFKKDGSLVTEGRLNAGNLSIPVPEIGETPYFYFDTSCTGEYEVGAEKELDNLKLTVECDIDVGDDSVDVYMGPIKLTGTVGKQNKVFSLSKPGEANVFERIISTPDGTVLVKQQKQCIATATLHKI